MWSKTKKQLDSFLADGLKNRIKYDCVIYRAIGSENRISILLDNKIIFSACDGDSERLYRKIRKEHKDWGRDQLLDNLEQCDKFEMYDFSKAIEEYLLDNIDTNLNSNNKLKIVLALLDRRVGKRRLQKLMYLRLLHKDDIIAKVYDLRYEIEFGKI